MDAFLKELNDLEVRSNYAKTIALLRVLKAGEIGLDQVTLTDDGWQVAPALPPGTIAVEDSETVEAEEPAE